METKELVDAVVEIVTGVVDGYPTVYPLVEKIAALLPRVIVDVLKPILEDDDLKKLLAESKARTLKAYMDAGFSREEALSLMLTAAENLRRVFASASSGLKAK